MEFFLTILVKLEEQAFMMLICNILFIFLWLWIMDMQFQIEMEMKQSQGKFLSLIVA